MLRKAKSVWLGLLVYLLAEVALPVLKLARVAPVAHYSWWQVTCLIWGPALLLAAVFLLGLVFTPRADQVAPE